jgi:hypothetical protein
MRLDLPLVAAGFAACLCLAAPARANVNVYYHAGAWDAFDGQAENGQPLCGIGSENPADGRSFSMSVQIGGTDTTFLVHKPGWKIPQGTRIPVVLQLGLQRPWVEQATGNGDKVEWTMDQADAAAFNAQFRGAESMTVTFPSGNENPWIIELNGSSAVSNALRRCVIDLAQRAATPPQAAAPAAPTQPSTQPFAAAPGASSAAAPAQPSASSPAASAQQGTVAQPNQPAAPPATH